MKRNKTEKIDILVKKIMHNISSNGSNYQHLIFEEWKKVLGVIVSNATQKIYIKNNLLIVYLSSPTIKHELTFIREKLLEHLNKKFPEAKLKDIVFR